MPEKLEAISKSIAYRQQYICAVPTGNRSAAEKLNIYAAGRQFGVPTSYTWVSDFGQHMDSIFRGGATYKRE